MRYMICKCFYHSVGCLLFCWWFPLLCRSFLVWGGPAWLFLLFLPVLLVSYPKHYCQDKCQGTFSMFSSRSFRVSSLTFKSLIRFELIFVTPAFFRFPFAWVIFFHSLIFSLYVSLGLKWVSCRQHIYGSCICIHSVSLCLLVVALIHI